MGIYLKGCQLVVMLHAEGSLLAPDCGMIWVPEAADFSLTVLNDALGIRLAICVDPALLHAWGRLTLRGTVLKLRPALADIQGAVQGVCMCSFTCEALYSV